MRGIGVWAIQVRSERDRMRGIGVWAMEMQGDSEKGPVSGGATWQGEGADGDGGAA